MVDNEALMEAAATMAAEQSFAEASGTMLQFSSTGFDDDDDTGIGEDDELVGRKQSLHKRQEALTRKLSNRMEPKELVERGVLLADYKNMAPTLHAVRVELERAKKGDILNRKISNRPEKRELIEKGIVKDSNVDPSLQARQLQLERWQLQDGLDEKMFVRPGPLELVRDKILEEPAPGIQEIQTGTVAFRKTSESPMRRRSSFLRTEKRSKSDLFNGGDEALDSRLVEINELFSDSRRRRRQATTNPPDPMVILEPRRDGLLDLDPSISVDFLDSETLMELTDGAQLASVEMDEMQLGDDAMGTAMRLTSPLSIDSMRSPSTYASEDFSKPSTPSAPTTPGTPGTAALTNFETMNTISEVEEQHSQQHLWQQQQELQQQQQLLLQQQQQPLLQQQSRSDRRTASGSGGLSPKQSSKKKRKKPTRLKFHHYQPQVQAKVSAGKPRPAVQVENSPYALLLQQQQLYLQLQILYEQNLQVHKDHTGKSVNGGSSQSLQQQQMLLPSLSLHQASQFMLPQDGEGKELGQLAKTPGGGSTDGSLIPPPPPPPLRLRAIRGGGYVSEGQLEMYQKRLDQLNMDQLKVELRSRDLHVSGRKKELVMRLLPFAGSIIKDMPVRPRTEPLLQSEPFFPPLNNALSNPHGDQMPETSNSSSIPVTSSLNAFMQQPSQGLFPMQMPDSMSSVPQQQQHQLQSQSAMPTGPGQPIFDQIRQQSETDVHQQQQQFSDGTGGFATYQLPRRGTAPTSLGLWGTSRAVQQVTAAHKSSSMPSSPIESPMLRYVLHSAANRHLHDNALLNSAGSSAAGSPLAGSPSASQILNHFPVSTNGDQSNAYTTYGSPSDSPFLRSSPPIMLDSVIRSPSDSLLVNQADGYGLHRSPSWQMQGDSTGMLPQGGHSPNTGNVGTPSRSRSFHTPVRHAVRPRAYTYDGGQMPGYQSSPNIVGLDGDMQLAGFSFGAVGSPAKSSIEYLDIQQSPSTAAVFGMHDCSGGPFQGSPQHLGSGGVGAHHGLGSGDGLFGAPLQQDLMFHLEPGEVDAAASNLSARPQPGYGGDLNPGGAGGGFLDCMTAGQYAVGQSQEMRHSWPRVQ